MNNKDINFIAKYRNSHINRLRFFDKELKLNVKSYTLFIFPELSEWIQDPEYGYAWMRIVKNGNLNDVNDRRIFVEKTPRVYDPSLNLLPKDFRSWVEGPKSNLGDITSRIWADAFAKALGYKFEI